MTNMPPVVSGALPVIGHIPQFVRDRSALLKRGFEEQGEIFSIRLPKPVTVVAGSELNRWFYSETDKSLNMSKPYEFLKVAIGEVLFTASKELYEEQRPLLKIIFSNERMAGYLVAMNVEVDRWLARLGDEGEVDVSAAMLRLTQYVAGHAFVGRSFEEELGADFWDAYADIGSALDPVFPPHWPLPKFRRRDRAKARIREILAPVCARRRQDPGAYDDVISILVNTELPDGRTLSQDAVVSLWTGLMFAGHETTAGQAAWSIILPLQHPDVAERMRAELAPLDDDEPLGPKQLRSSSSSTASSTRPHGCARAPTFRCASPRCRSISRATTFPRARASWSPRPPPIRCRDSSMTQSASTPAASRRSAARDRTPTPSSVSAAGGTNARE